VIRVEYYPLLLILGYFYLNLLLNHLDFEE
jgi:hypothetical protein